MVPQRGDPPPQPVERLGAERPLDLFEVSRLRPLRADAPPPDRIPEIVQVGQPLAARDRRPFAGVEPDAGAGGAAIEMEDLPAFDPRAPEEAVALRTEAWQPAGGRRRAPGVRRRRDDVLLD